MRCRPWASFALGLAALIPLSVAQFTQAQAVDDVERSLDATIGEPPADAADAEGVADDAVEELTRGPVHEAFAEQVSPDPTPSVVVKKAPPEPIEEIPPENKPADAKAIWIDGYWAFDDVDERYIWVSGVWRVAPTGYRWTPGYWTEAEGGWRWIGGFWSSADRSEVAYQPAPPESLEEGPTSAAPSEDHIWVPGCWYYRDARYAWRPGYWTPGNDNWVWIPNYYRYTPRGYVLCGGYWDVPLATRGCLFAPVYFNRPIYTTPGWYYTPRVSIGLGPLHFHLFVRPNYCHYYFGDYYGPNFVNRGWYPWHTFHRRPHAYDPLFAYNVWHYKRRGIDFGDRYERWHKYYDRHEDRRPRHTFKDQRDWVAKHRDGDRDGWQQSAIARRFEEQVSDRRERFVNLDQSERERYKEIGNRVRDFRRERARIETVADARDGQREGRDRLPEVGRNVRDLPTLKLPGAVSRGGRNDEGDVGREDRALDLRNRGDRPEFGRRESADLGDDESRRNVLRPELGRDGEGLPRDLNEQRGDERHGERPERGPRVDAVTPPGDRRPETPSATPGDSPRTLPRFERGSEEGRSRSGNEGNLPTLPRSDRGDQAPRVNDPSDRSRFLPQPGTVRDSERPFNTDRGSDARRAIDANRGATPTLPRVTPTPRSDSPTPRVETPRVETPAPRTIDRGALERGGLESRRGANPFGSGDRPSLTPSTPRTQQPSPRVQPTPRFEQPSRRVQQPSPRIQTNRPSIDRGSIAPRMSPRGSGGSPSFTPRSSGSARGAGSAFTPRSSGGGRSAPSMRSGGGGFGRSGIGNRGGGGGGGRGRGRD